MKYLFIGAKVFFLTVFLIPLWGEIREIDHINEVFSAVKPESVVFFDIDETLIESPVMLGGKAWRRYVFNLLKTVKTEKESSEIHDRIDYFLVQRIPFVSIEISAVLGIDALQKRQIPVFCLTARGKEHWYDQPCSKGEELTFLHLKQAGFDFPLFNFFRNEPFFSHPSYSRGVFFAYPTSNKGDLVLELFSKTRDRPSHIIFVDDKKEQVHSVSRALEQLGIPALCFHYRHIELYRTFDPMIANIQLEELYFEKRVLSDGEAALLKSDYPDKNPDEYFLKLIERMKIRGYI